MNEIIKPDAFSEEIAKSLLEGTITESEQGLLVKKIQIAIGSTLLKSITSITSQYAQLDLSIQRLLANLTPRLEELTADTPIDVLLDYYDKLTSIQVRAAELTRKVAQGKPLFDFAVMSDEERMVSNLMKSFSSQDEKREFMQLVRNWWSEKHPNE